MSAARVEVESWINRAEEAAQQVLDEALGILCAPPADAPPTADAPPPPAGEDA